MGTQDQTFIKHPQAVARDRWFESGDGVVACSGTASGQYLHNRLAHAYSAGWEACQAHCNSAPSPLADRLAEALREVDDLLASQGCKPDGCARKRAIAALAEYDAAKKGEKT